MDTDFGMSIAKALLEEREKSASPDLLEALRAAKTWLEGWASAESELAIIDAAISKAEGTSQ